MPPWTPSFGTYHAWPSDGSIVMVTVDQAAVAGIGRDHPIAFSFVIELQDPLENGLLSAEERPKVAAVEEAVAAVLRDQGEPWLAGWRNERGLRFVFYYLQDHPTRAVIDHEWPHGYELGNHAAPDPDWQEYRESLAPTPFQTELIRSNRQLFEIDRLGGDSASERVVDHTMLFADPASAKAGAAALAAAGFTVAKRDGDVVACTRTHDLRIVTLERVIDQCLTAIAPHGGRYDGWGAPLQPGARRSAERPRRLFRR